MIIIEGVCTFLGRRAAHRVIKLIHDGCCNCYNGPEERKKERKRGGTNGGGIHNVHIAMSRRKQYTG